MIPIILNYLLAFAVVAILTGVLVAVFLIFNAIGKSIMEQSTDDPDETDEPWSNEDDVSDEVSD